MYFPEPFTFKRLGPSTFPQDRPLSPRPEFIKNNFSRKKPFQGISMAKSEEYSSYATNLFFKNPESVHAKRFQDRNSILIFIKLLPKKIDILNIIYFRIYLIHS